jgi:hypothetical protein
LVEIDIERGYGQGCKFCRDAGIMKTLVNKNLLIAFAVVGRIAFD